MFDIFIRTLFILISSYTFLFIKKFSNFFTIELIKRMKILLFVTSFFAFINTQYYIVINCKVDLIALWASFNYEKRRKFSILFRFWIEFIVEVIPNLFLASILVSLNYVDDTNEQLSINSNLLQDEEFKNDLPDVFTN